MRLIHTCIRVYDLERSIDFYVNKLGFELKRKFELPGADATLAYVSPPGQEYEIGGLAVAPFATSHDCDEPLGFSIADGRSRAVVATDLGVVGRSVRRHLLEADCVIPTTQNHANIQDDLTLLVTQQAREGMTDADLELLCSMLVRAYDPCISCSVH